MRRPQATWRKLLLVTILVGLFLLNGIAWVQAWSMTHYASSGQRTPKPEELSLPQKAWAIVSGVTVPKPTNTHDPSVIDREHETRNIPLQDGSHLEAWYVPHANATGLVLMFPGYAESKESLLPAAAALHELGYNLLMVDFRGAGGSSGTDTTLGVREAKDVARAVEYARLEWPNDPVVLYGVSMGSAAIMRAIAVEGIQADAAILESPFDRLLSTVRNRFHAMGLPGTPGSELVVFWGSVQQGFNGFEHNPLDYASSIRCPTLVLYGENDPRVTPSEFRAIYDRLAGPKELVGFPGAAHEALVVYAPENWREKVAGFLAATSDK